MARQALVLDASVGVKWFSPKDETALNQALSIRDAHIAGEAMILVPDLFYYEVTNAIVHKKFFSVDTLKNVASALFSLGLQTITINADLLKEAAGISRQFNVTVYDSSYIAIARNYKALWLPLIPGISAQK